MSNQIGDQYRLHASFTANGVPTSPDVVTLTVRRPDGTSVTPTPTEDGPGEFTYYLLLEQAGIYLWRFNGTGTVFATEEGWIEVDQSLFESHPAGAATRDYFTRAEFRAFASDDTDPATYADEAIDLAQSEVIERLEEWARSSWANVTGVAGNGTALDYRAAVDDVSGTGVLVLPRVPIVEVTSLTLEGNTTPEDPASYRVTESQGIIRIGSAVVGFPVSVSDPIWGWPGAVEPRFSVAYTYGWGSCPQSVKMAAMKAARSRLDATLYVKAGAGSRIPANTRRLVSSRAELEFAVVEADDPTKPWPWDPAASAEIAAFWGHRRPRQRLAVYRGA